MSCCIICIVLVQYRVANIKPGEPLKITLWDANGYYLYLPSLLIYHDYKELKWLDAIDKKYAVTGGAGYQAQKADNGNYTFKYLGGVALMELPFFYVGHWVAQARGYPPDGFSPPYQYALGFGILFYCMLAIFLLRKILLLYFSDATVAITLLLLCLATNFIQYAAVDSGQSHAYIFLLYTLVIFTTLKWHEKPTPLWACLTGYIVGLATISRPTEAIMLFIPLMWQTQNKDAAQQKWQMVKQHKIHIAGAAVFGIIGILPQLLYWKASTGHFIYDVGSKWKFLNPYFRVLFGFEKGWFIYTPATVLFIVGMFFIRKFPFRKSVLWFCLLNIYIIIAWDDWRYGGSYSTRALVQSYPAFALPLGTLVERIQTKKWRPVFYLLCAYLLFVNLFQITQYCNTILHFNDMNRAYYGRVYLNPNPDPVDMSLLDNDEVLNSEIGYNKKVLFSSSNINPLHFNANDSSTLLSYNLGDVTEASNAASVWLKITSEIHAPGCLWQTFLFAQLTNGDSAKLGKVRLYSPISSDTATNKYAFYVQVPRYFAKAKLRVLLTSPFAFNGEVRNLEVTELNK